MSNFRRSQYVAAHQLLFSHIRCETPASQRHASGFDLRANETFVRPHHVNEKQGEKIMIVTIKMLRRALALTFSGVLFCALGCADSTTQEDVADAREEVREEQQDVAEAKEEANENIAEAQDNTQEYTASKPVTDDEAADAHAELAETQQEAAEDIKDEQEDVAAAQADLRTEEQRLAATQARDAYVQEIEGQLASIEKDIEQMKEQASNAEGANKDELDQKIAGMEAHHDRVQEALDDLKSADINEWQNHRQHVRTAMQELETSRNVR